jgi:hypothetical protein
VEPALVLRYGRFAKSCSPDEATLLRLLRKLRRVRVRRSAERVGGSEIRGNRYRFDHAPWVSLRSTRATKQRTKENIGGETPTDARSSSAAPCGCGRDSAPGFYFLGRGGQGWPVRRAGVTRPYLSQSSDQTRPGRSAEGLLPKAARERVAKPRAGTALARRAVACRPPYVRLGEVGAM